HQMSLADGNGCDSGYELTGDDRTDVTAYLAYKHGPGLAWNAMQALLLRGQVSTWRQLFRDQPSIDAAADAALQAVLARALAAGTESALADAARRAEAEERARP